MSADRYTISRSSMGSFLDPPGSPQYTHSITIRRGSREVGWMSLEAALKDETVPESVRANVQALYDRAEMRCTEQWMSQVYGYFKNCYSPDGEDRNVSNCLIVKPNPDGFGYVLGPFGRDGWIKNLPPAEHHLAVMLIRQYFPDHEPRTDLMETGKWGK